MPKFSYLCWIASAFALQACGGATDVSDTPVVSVSMHCGDQATTSALSYSAENNPWGKVPGDVSTQCIGLGVNATGALFGRWTWDWSSANSAGSVKAYPEVIFGRKPGAVSTSPALPKRIGDINVAMVSYDVSSVHTGKGNTAFDIWLTDTANPAVFDAPPITHEIMIWIESYGNLAPSGFFLERINIAGSAYDVFVADNFGLGWRYIAFQIVTPQLGVASLDLALFFSYLTIKGLITDSAHLASIEFGNEIVSGTGETRLDAYAVDLQ